jgi:hypothetical protein
MVRSVRMTHGMRYTFPFVIGKYTLFPSCPQNTEANLSAIS